MTLGRLQFRIIQILLFIILALLAGEQRCFLVLFDEFDGEALLGCFFAA